MTNASVEIYEENLTVQTSILPALNKNEMSVARRAIARMRSNVKCNYDELIIPNTSKNAVHFFFDDDDVHGSMRSKVEFAEQLKAMKDDVMSKFDNGIATFEQMRRETVLVRSIEKYIR